MYAPGPSNKIGRRAAEPPLFCGPRRRGRPRPRAEVHAHLAVLRDEVREYPRDVLARHHVLDRERVVVPNQERLRPVVAEAAGLDDRTPGATAEDPGLDVELEEERLGGAHVAR